MTGLTYYSVDSAVRRKAFISVAAFAILSTILFNFMFLPCLKEVMAETFGSEIIDQFDVAGLISFSGIGVFTLFGIYWVVFDLWLWHFPPFQTLHGIPNLNGEWSGELLSSFKTDSDKNTKRSMRLVITQTFSKMQCVAHYSSSSSSSLIVGIRECNSRTRSCLLEYLYTNEASKMSVVNPEWESDHLGFCHIRCVGNNMDGQYFTNRISGTKGALSLRRK